MPSLTFRVENVIVQRFGGISSVAHGDEEGPEAVYTGAEDIISDAERREDRREEQQEDEGGRPPAQEAEGQREAQRAEHDRRREVSEAEQQLARAAHAQPPRLERVEVEDGEECEEGR